MATATLVRSDADTKAIEYLEAFLSRTPDRNVFGRNEVQDLLLDLHLILDPITK